MRRCRDCFIKGVQSRISGFKTLYQNYLLMPRFILEDVRRRTDLPQWSHLYAIADELGITISNLTHRLQKLNWLTIPPGSRQVYQGKAAKQALK